MGARSIPHLALLGRKPAKMANFLTFDLYIGISVAICLIVMLNYVYFCLTYNGKEVMKGNRKIKSFMK